MKRLVLFLAAAVMVSTVLAGFKYEGEWGEFGTGNGQFNMPLGVDVAPNGNVYVADSVNDRFQYFTADGSFLGKWSYEYADGLAIAPNGNVYAGGCDEGSRVLYFSPTGSLLGSWRASFDYIVGGDVAPNGNVYVAETLDYRFKGVVYYTGTGSRLGSWRNDYAAYEVGIGPNRNVYVTFTNDRVQYFTPEGLLLGSWGSPGSGPGEFNDPMAVDVAPDGQVFVADTGNDRVQYFTANGSFLGEWGTAGSGPGQFYEPRDVAVSRTGGRVYVADSLNHRIQYFVDAEYAVTPTSLGKVKALFK